ncbi:MAG: BON domain-containing protein [Burkholderiales bacterium]|nr:BON domain-containing protein [Burkholderiales bacterium]
MKTSIPALILAAAATFATGAFAQTVILVPSSSLTQDQLIKSEVMDRIASDQRPSGQIGVETQDNVVTLTGRVLDPDQIEWAAQDARGVDGVTDVNNLVRASLLEF